MKLLYTLLIYYFSIMIIYIVVESILQHELETTKVIILPFFLSIIMIAFKKQEWSSLGIFNSLINHLQINVLIL